MKVAFTSQMTIAISLMAITVVCTLGALIGSNGHWSVPVSEYRVVGPDTNSSVFPADKATSPLVPDLSDVPSHNPFNSRSGNSTGYVRIAVPPRPQLDYPPLPVLPAALR
jgi:hypothetical protein